MTTFEDAVHSSNVIEALENYSRADSPFDRSIGESMATDHDGRRSNCDAYDDELFWRSIFQNQTGSLNRGWGNRYRVLYCYLTAWVARVPGLDWKPESKAQRQRGESFIESRSQNWHTFTPHGKSHKVAGGIGTLRLPPDDRGYRLATLSGGMNASSGIPILISAELWDQATAGTSAEGRYIKYASGTWQAMGLGWADRFESIKGLPQGYLVIDELRVGDHVGPVEFHPFSIMEYETEHRKLFDFVYASADLGDRNWRGGIETFFESYRSLNGRQ